MDEVREQYFIFKRGHLEMAWKLDSASFDLQVIFSLVFETEVDHAFLGLDDHFIHEFFVENDAGVDENVFTHFVCSQIDADSEDGLVKFKSVGRFLVW